MDTIKLADYLFARLRQLGVNSVFGVPGDYNLRLLDFVEPAKLSWIGTCNELNAAYSADGYARINGLAALVTTFGVGELSALNGIAGAYAERSPVIHIVGTPPRQAQSTRALMHHTFADGEYRRFAAMSTHITAAQTEITDAASAPDKIDWILQQALLHSRPVYLEIPDDMPDVLVSAAKLTKAVAVPPVPSTGKEPQIVNQILERMYTAKRPLILVDGESVALGVVDQLDTLIKKTGWPTWCTVFSKGLVNEQLPNVYGLYAAAFGDEPAKAYFESADLILTFGPHYSDTNSYFFTSVPAAAAAVTFKDSSIQIGTDPIYRDVSGKDLFSQLLQNIDTTRIPKTTEAPPKVVTTLDDIKSSDLIAQDNFFRLVNPIFQEGDIILTETGTASHGGRHFNLPPKARVFGAVTWLSIGFMLPATLGAALAKREQRTPGNVILIIGDGSLQMTAQEISTMIRQKLDILIIIINNDGYTIERVIHGRNQSYNDVATWRHTEALSYFGADDDHVAKSTFTARTCGELQDVLQKVQNGKGVRLVEAYMGREDVQGALLYLLNKQLAQEKKEE